MIGSSQAGTRTTGNIVKPMFTTGYEGEWAECIHKFLDPHDTPLEAFNLYTRTLGKFYDGSFNTTLFVWDPCAEVSTLSALHTVD